MNELIEVESSMPRLNPVKVNAALGNAQRWQIFQMMAGGEEVTLRDLARRMKRSYRAVHKDMDVLCAAGIASWRLMDDKRVAAFFLPAEFRARKGIVDFGFAQWRVVSD